MKTNSVPCSIRLRHRIGRLLSREAECWERIGGGNPYLRCRHCGVTNVEETVRGHRKACPVKGVKKEVAHYQGLLVEVESGQT